MLARNAVTSVQKDAPRIAAAPAQLPVAPGTERERARLDALDRLDILDTPSEEAFDRITRLTRKIFDVPAALVSFIDGHRQWYKSSLGMSATEIPREESFCRHVIEEDRTMIVPDVSKCERFAQHPRVVGDPYVRFYAGVPLRTRDGHSVGTLCIFDTKPRDFAARDEELLSDLANMAADELQLRLCATTDPLTGALSRRAFKEEVERATSLALRHHDDLSIIAIDLDYFKSINDTHGHAAGDAVLRKVVELCREQLRNTDLFGRLGGEEFAALLPQTGAVGAMDVAERMRKAVAASVIEHGSTRLMATASLGVASLDATARDADILLSRADTALYQAKEAGKNRAVAWRNENVVERLPGRRVLKSGQILFNGHMSSMDCTVRRLSEEGAGLEVSGTVGIPPRFDLAIKADKFLKPCRVVGQAERHVDVEFI